MFFPKAQVKGTSYGMVKLNMEFELYTRLNTNYKDSVADAFSLFSEVFNDATHTSHVLKAVCDQLNQWRTIKHGPRT